MFFFFIFIARVRVFFFFFFSFYLTFVPFFATTHYISLIIIIISTLYLTTVFCLFPCNMFSFLCIISLFFPHSSWDKIINNHLIYGYISEIITDLLMSSDQKTATTTSTDATPGFQINQKKLKELAENANAIKIGGKVRENHVFCCL